MRYALTLGLLGAAATVVAHPTHKQPKEGVRRRAVDLDALRPGATASYVAAPQVPAVASIAAKASGDYIQTATELVKSVVPGAEFRVVDDSYVGANGVAHVHFKQTAHGLDIDNADFNVNVRNGAVFSYGNNFFTGAIPTANPLTKRDFNDAATALKGAIDVLALPITTGSTAVTTVQAAEGSELYTLEGTSGAVSSPQAKLTYLVKGDGSLGLTWRVETDIEDNWLLSYVDANDNTKVHNVVDYVSHATYQVYPWGVNDPTEAGASRVVVKDPWDIAASPFTWHKDSSSVSYTATRGNNAIAQSNPSGGSAYLNNFRPDSATLDFQYPYDLTMTPPTTYTNASIAQLFYTGNVYHDLLYELGFNEQAGNFQTNNNGKGGVANDFVILNAQDGSGTNNANFATPPDGQPGRMRMYLWTTATPQRDCSFEAGVVIHEYTHGVSNRLTGGPANTGCLSALESGGMGEGWGDFMATAIRLKPNDTAATDYPMGAWVSNKPQGIRTYVYSTSLTTNKHTYGSTNSLSAVHAIGNVWATMLYEVLWALIAKHGKNDAGRPEFDANGVPTDGKYLTMKLVLDGMALQPCNPNFVQARDAIIDADEALTGGANACPIWTAFAKRGLGSAAKYGSSQNSVESFDVPTGVC